MNKDVKVVIEGRQYSESAAQSTSSIATCQGQFYEKNGKYFVAYEETSEDGDVFKCMLKFNDTILEHSKNGVVVSRFIFEKGEKHLSDYETPFGIFRMGISTKHYVAEIDEEKIRLHAIYEMEINEEFASENEIIISIS